MSDDRIRFATNVEQADLFRRSLALAQRGPVGPRCIGPTVLADLPEPDLCASVVACDGTGTYRRSLRGDWQRVARADAVDWQTVQDRLAGVQCWVLLPNGEDREWRNR